MIKTQCVVVRGNLNALRYSNKILTPVCIPHLQNNGRIRLMHDHGSTFTYSPCHKSSSPGQPDKRSAMVISIAGFKSGRAHLGRNWPKGKEPCTAQHTGFREIRS